MNKKKFYIKDRLALPLGGYKFYLLSNSLVIGFPDTHIWNEYHDKNGFRDVARKRGIRI